MAKVVIFGTHDFAELAFFYLSRESTHQVVAFTVDEQYNNYESFMDLPVISFETLDLYFPPQDVNLFAPLSPTKMSTLRQSIYEKITAKGYKCISYISPRATYYDTPVGDNCFILEDNVIQPFTTIGNNVVMWSGNHLGHHSSIGDNTFIASHAVISGHVNISENCFLGVNSTLSNNIYIAPFTFIGAGALVTSSTKEFQVYPGISSELSRVPSNKLRGI